MTVSPITEESLRNCVTDAHTDEEVARIVLNYYAAAGENSVIVVWCSVCGRVRVDSYRDFKTEQGALCASKLPRITEEWVEQLTGIRM